MAIIKKKKTTVKPAVKKINTKLVIKKTDKAPALKKSDSKFGIISWLFLPDLSLAGAKMRWAVRALIFTLLFMTMVVVTGAIGVQAQLASIGFADVTFWSALDMTISSLAQFPFRMTVSTILVFLLGAFMFMPRKLLAKDDAVAIFGTYSLWLIISVLAVHTISYFNITSSLATLPVFTIMLATMTALMASVFLYARNFGVKKYLLFLSAPFGLGWYSWQVFFMPGMGKKNALTIRMNWYKKFINLCLYTKYGQIAMAAILIPLTIYFSPTPWDIATIGILAAIFLWKGGKWIMERFKTFAWLAVAINTVLYIRKHRLLPSQKTGSLCNTHVPKMTRYKCLSYLSGSDPLSGEVCFSCLKKRASI